VSLYLHVKFGSARSTTRANVKIQLVICLERMDTKRFDSQKHRRKLLVTSWFYGIWYLKEVDAVIQLGMKSLVVPTKRSKS
jgi:hypothetical protein